MSGRPHIVILGAGLIGLSCADALLRRGAKVTLLETREAPMCGASFANSGMIHPSQACSWVGDMNDPKVDAAVHELACRSRDLILDRMNDLGLTAMRARRPGCSQIFDTEDQVDQAQARLVTRGIHAERFLPGQKSFQRPGLFYAEDRSGDAFVYGQALAEAIRAAGGEIHLGLEKPNLDIFRDGTVCIRVGEEILTADSVVIACGSQTSAALEPLGMSVDIHPIRGWAVDYDTPGSILLPDHPIMDAATRSALTPYKDWFRLSGTWGEDNERVLVSRWSEIAPELMSNCRQPRQIWSGLRPVSGKGRPYIGPTRVPNLWINAGHGHMGWTLCAGSGALMADMILEGREDQRFAHVDLSDIFEPKSQ